jgi:hypothetical protein
VVRLKGGDPFIFGRGGEEVEELVKAGMPFEVMPGITAAAGIGAYAGIPLTHRDFAQSCIFVTGHLKDGTVDLDWDMLARPRQTLVFYMGITQLATICAQLVAHGLPATTPAAVVRRGTTRAQRVVTSDLAGLPRSRPPASPPALTIVGDVVSLQPRLAWFHPENPPARPALCPALFVAAPASGQGKTTVTAALARLHVRQGRKVRVFKCGPDFSIRRSTRWPAGAGLQPRPGHVRRRRRRLAPARRGAQEADLILVEGVMGLFDGSPSGADIARRFGIPVMAVIDAKAMAQTFGALVHGLATWQPDLPFSGVLANHVGSEGHARCCRTACAPASPGMAPCPGTPTRRCPSVTWACCRPPRSPIWTPASIAWPTTWRAPAPPTAGGGGLSRRAGAPRAPLLQGRRIAIARDAAFGFIYPANLDTLQALGAELAFFSPWPASRCPPATPCGCPAATRSSTPLRWPPTPAGRPG